MTSTSEDRERTEAVRLKAENERLREALRDIAVYGCGMLNQPAAVMADTLTATLIIEKCKRDGITMIVEGRTFVLRGGIVAGLRELAADIAQSKDTTHAE